MTNQKLFLSIICLCINCANIYTTPPEGTPFMQAYKDLIGALQSKGFVEKKLTKPTRYWKKKILTFSKERAKKHLEAFGISYDLPDGQSFFNVYQYAIKQQPDQAGALKEALLTIEPSFTQEWHETTIAKAEEADTRKKFTAYMKIQGDRFLAGAVEIEPIDKKLSSKLTEEQIVALKTLKDEFKKAEQKQAEQRRIDKTFYSLMESRRKNLLEGKCFQPIPTEILKKVTMEQVQQYYTEFKDQIQKFD